MTYLGRRTGYSPYPGMTIHRVFSRYLLTYNDSQPILLSPFYLYPNLPPFIVATNAEQNAATDATSDDENDDVAVGDPSTVAQTVAALLSPDQKSQTTQALDQVSDGFADAEAAVMGLKKAWESADPAMFAKLCPQSGQVSVSVVNDTFKLDAKDFVDLMKDGAVGTKTTKWSVVDLHSDPGQTTLKALHVFDDAAGKPRSVYQTYTLAKEANGYVIRSFGSEPYTDQTHDAGPEVGVSLN